jgi:ribosomal protein L11 methyltransferase
MRPEEETRTWHAVTITCDQTATEAVEYGLCEAGALGTETRNRSDGLARTIGYFAAPPALDALRIILHDALRIYGLDPSHIDQVGTEEIGARDWIAEWKRHWQPVHVGRFLIAPPWYEINAAPDQIVIRIEPGMAFGTGTHETTRLCLHAIERHFRGGDFLDVGTGTGILAIAAAKLHPESRIMACDIDPQAIEIARENAQRNEVAERIDFYVGTLDEQTPSVACLVANLTADIIEPMLPKLLDIACEHLILSGILVAQADRLLARLIELGATQREVAIEGEWVAIIV